MRVLVLGSSGMLGNAMLRVLSERDDWVVYGTLRRPDANLQAMAPKARYLYGIHADQSDTLLAAFAQSRPQVVINCIGLVKQLANSEDPLEAIPVNSLLPHRLARLCDLAQARLVHISTDCVFSGSKGNYSEIDLPDAQDVYGRSKLIGEVHYDNAVTLRTSIIGHEIYGNHSLIDWFLSQEGSVKGFSRAVFSGLPTTELANVVQKYVIPDPSLKGLYHVSANPIDKYSLLKLVAHAYNKKITIIKDSDFVIDRSLDSSKFRVATGFRPKPWPELIDSMRNFS